MSGKPLGEVEQIGVGAVLSVYGDTRPMNNFFRQLPERFGYPVDRSNLHVTLVDYRDAMIDVFTDRDLIALRHAQHGMSKHLTPLPLRSVVLHPDGERLLEFGRFLGFEVKQTPFIEDTRAVLAAIVLQELGIDLSNANFVPHVSVVRTTSRSRRIHQRDFVPPLPQDLHLNGFDINLRIEDSDPKRQKSKQRFAHRPKGLR